MTPSTIAERTQMLNFLYLESDNNRRRADHYEGWRKQFYLDYATLLWNRYIALRDSPYDHLPIV